MGSLGPSKALSTPSSISPTPTEWLKSGSIGALALATNLALFFIPTPHCSWCKTNDFDKQIGRALAVKDLEQASSLSHFLTLGVVPITTLIASAGFSKTKEQFALHALVLFDSAMATLALSQAIKISARREIPELYFKNPYADNRFKNQSFLSGHTSLAFSLLSTASVLAFREKASFAPYFTAFAAAAGLLVGYSRIASGKHWASDVLAGMGLGIAVGVAMPFLIYETPKLFSEQVAVSLAPLFLDNKLFIQVSLR